MKAWLGGLALAGLVATGATAQDTKVAIGIAGWTGFAPLTLAKEAGIFKKNGLDVSLKMIPQKDRHLAIASGDVKVPENANPSQERQLLLAVANRPIDTNTTFTTGGDVSRFQRRTVPAKPLNQSGSSGAPGASGGSAAPTGPVVRIARGNEITVVPVGAR